MCADAFSASLSDHYGREEICGSVSVVGMVSSGGTLESDWRRIKRKYTPNSMTRFRTSQSIRLHSNESREIRLVNRSFVFGFESAFESFIKELSRTMSVKHKGGQLSTSEMQSENPLPLPCSHCGKLTCSLDLVMFDEDPDEALEEFALLTDPVYILLSDSEKVDQRDLRPKHKIVNFTIYDADGHVCRLDDGLIEKDVALYVSGYVKPIYEEDTELNGGKWGKRLGPINEWWISEFDGGNKALVGVSTEFAEYILAQPSCVYENYWRHTCEKANLSKIMIEFLLENATATFGDLVNEIANFFRAHATSGVAARLAIEALKKHGSFLVDQVVSYDNHRSDEDSVFLTRHSCFVKFMKKISKWREDAEARASGHKNFKNSRKRRRRCGKCSGCSLSNCGKCNNCRDMVRFGGNGSMKKACLLRKCLNLK